MHDMDVNRTELRAAEEVASDAGWSSEMALSRHATQCDAGEVAAVGPPDPNHENDLRGTVHDFR